MRYIRPTRRHPPCAPSNQSSQPRAGEPLAHLPIGVRRAGAALAPLCLPAPVAPPFPFALTPDLVQVFPFTHAFPAFSLLFAITALRWNRFQWPRTVQGRLSVRHCEPLCHRPWRPSAGKQSIHGNIFFRQPECSQPAAVAPRTPSAHILPHRLAAYTTLPPHPLRTVS